MTISAGESLSWTWRVIWFQTFLEALDLFRKIYPMMFGTFEY